MRPLAIVHLTVVSLFSAAPFVTVATAGEHIVMPYACRVIDGEPVLAPSEDREYPILGEREERDFTVCSPSDADVCKSRLLYRFDIDCAGHRVSWGAVSAAAEAYNGSRSWFEDERLHLVPPWTWSVWPSEPCASLRSYRWSHSLLGWYCGTSSIATSDEVRTPPSFAPLLDRSVFVTEMAPRSVGARTIGLPRIVPPVPKPARGINIIGPELTVAASVSGSQPPTNYKSAIVPLPSTTNALEGNRLESASVGALASLDLTLEPDQSGEAKEQETTFLSARAKGIAPSVRQAAADEKFLPPSPTEQETGRADALSRVVERLPILLIVALCSAVGVLVFALLPIAFNAGERPKKTKQSAADTALAPSFASHELRSNSCWLAPTAMPVRPISPEVQIELTNPSADAVPASRHEALQVLRMGIAQEINIIAAKKIIDGLRLSWHPDHARSPEDRRLRQMRLRQINVAWEWIAGRRAE